MAGGIVKENIKRVLQKNKKTYSHLKSITTPWIMSKQRLKNCTTVILPKPDGEPILIT